MNIKNDTQMKKVTSYIIAVALMMTTACNNKPKPVIINPDLLKYDWILENRQQVRLFIENDSLMRETLTSSEIPISSYKISHDTLFIFGKDLYKPQARIYDIKIMRVDSLKLVLEIPKPGTQKKDSLVFHKHIYTKKNDLKIERIEFASRSGFGYRQNLIIDSDSILYNYSYGDYNIFFPTKHKGLSKHKLSPVEFSKIQNKLNSIDWSNIESDNGNPGSGFRFLFIKTPNGSIEISGSLGGRDNIDFHYFIEYLVFLERFVNLNSIENEEVSFRYKFDW